MILIRSAQIVDGTGKSPFVGDVLINGGKIAAIGNFPGKKAELVIAGLGQYLAPGFIDINTDSDHQLTLFTHPDQKEFLLGGVTTIFGGMCGSSLAPLIYGSMESIQKWTDTNKVSVNWQAVGEFFEMLQKRKLGVNFGTLVGHSTIRRAIIGETSRDLTDRELAVFKQLLEQSLSEGAFGLSFGLGYLHSRDTPYEEIKSLTSVVKKTRGLVAIHLREEKELFKSLREVLELERQTQVEILVNHLRPLSGAEIDFERALVMFAKGGRRLHFDIYPYDESLVPIYSLLPQWAQQDGISGMFVSLLDPLHQKQVLSDLPQYKKGELRIVEAPGARFLEGEVIGDGRRGLMKIMLSTRLRAILAWKNINYQMLLSALEEPAALVASNDAAPPRLRKDAFLKFLRLTKLPIESAIKKLTAIPAAKLCLKERGQIKEGFFADLVLLDNEKNIKTVIVNGEPAVLGGRYENIYAGQILKKT